MNQTHNVNDIQSVKSRINEIRHDHKDQFVAIGELLDNSKDWGKASKIDIFLSSKRITICDNGTGIPHERLPNILKFGNENSDAKTGTIGRFGLGLNKGSIILCEQVSVFTHHIDAPAFSKTEADWVSMSERNRYTPDTAEMTEQEKELFDEYSDSSTGTIVFLKELRHRIDKTFKDKLVMYCRSLFQQMEGLSIAIKFDEEEPTIITEWYDPILYNESLDEHKSYWKINVYKDGKGDYKSVIETSDGLFVVKPKPSKHKVSYPISPTKKTHSTQPYYVFEVRMTRLSDELLNYEADENKHTNWEYKKGIYFYRAFRNLNGFVGIKGILSFIQGMNRGAGVRIRVNFEAFDKEFDDYFGVSSLKMIQESSYTNMQPFLREVIAGACTETHKKYEKYIGDMKDECDEEFKRVLKLIIDNTFSEKDIPHLKESVEYVFIAKKFERNGRIFEYNGGNAVHKFYKEVNRIMSFTDRFQARVNVLKQEQVQEQVEEQVQEQVVEPVQEQVVEQVQEQVVEQVQEQVQEPVQEQVQKPVVEQVQEQVQKPVVEQVQEQVQESVVEQVQEQVVEQGQEQVQEQVQESVVEQVQEPVVEQGQDVKAKILDSISTLLQDEAFSNHWTGDDTMLYNAISKLFN